MTLIKNDQLTTKYAYRLICSRNDANLVSMVNWKALWRLPLPQRVLLFGWKCLKNVVLVRTVVKSKISSLDDKCPICGKEEESIGHALMRCDFARASSFGLQWDLFSNSLSNSIHSANLMEWWKNSYERGQPNPLLGGTRSKMGILSIWWTIWKARNAFIHMATESYSWGYPL